MAEWNATTTSSYELLTEKVYKNWFVYKLTTTEVFDNGRTQKTFEKTEQGIKTKYQLDKFRQHLKFTNSKTHIAVLNDDLMKIAIEEGMDRGFLEKLDRHGFNADQENVYDLFVAGVVKKHNFIKGFQHGTWATDLDDRPLKIVFSFDYMAMGLDSRRYDLEKVVALWADNPRVTFMDSNFEATVQTGQEIQEVPYYNRDHSSLHKQLCVRYMLSDQEIDIFQNSSELKPEHGLHSIAEIAFNHDVFGLRKAGAALFDNFFEMVEFESEDDDTYDCY